MCLEIFAGLRGKCILPTPNSVSKLPLQSMYKPDFIYLIMHKIQKAIKIKSD